MSESVLASAYGGGQWSPRVALMTGDMASTWGDWGVSSEIRRLHAVLLRRPGRELDVVTDFDAMQMRSDQRPDVVREQGVAAIWPRWTPFKVVDTLCKRGFRFVEVDDEREAHDCLPMNVVALAPGEILMPAGGDRMRGKYEAAGARCQVIDISECIKAGDGIRCMTGFLKRDAVCNMTSGEEYRLQLRAEAVGSASHAA